MTDLKEKLIKKEQKCLKLSMYGGIFFVIIEFFMALVTKSQAVLMDSAYDAAELVLIIVSIKLVPLLYRPTTEKRPYGFSPVESWFILVKGFMLTAITVGLVISNIQIMLGGGRSVSFGLVAGFEIFAALVGIGVWAALRGMNRQIASPMVKTEMYGWMMDAGVSLGMGIAFLIPLLLDAGWVERIVPYLDQVVAIVLSAFILPIPIKTVIWSLRDLFLLAPEESTMEKIKETCEEILSRNDFRGGDYEVVKTGRKIWISIYVAPRNDMISISKWSQVQREMELALEAEFPNLYLELLPDIE